MTRQSITVAEHIRGACTFDQEGPLESSLWYEDMQYQDQGHELYTIHIEDQKAESVA